MDVQGDEAERRQHAAREIEDEEAQPAERLLDVVAEHEQEDHVAEQVAPAAVQEHVVTRVSFGRQRAGRMDLADQRRRRRAERGDDRMPGRAVGRDLDEEDQDIERDQPPGRERLHRQLERVVVVQRKNHSRPRHLAMFAGEPDAADQRFCPGTHRTSSAPLRLTNRLATNRKSDRRLTYLSAAAETSSPGLSASSTISRSPRRHTVRARCR